jgi:hypothetical protein
MFEKAIINKIRSKCILASEQERRMKKANWLSSNPI